MMYRSPHKRTKRTSLRVKEYKTTVSGNRGGRASTKFQRIPTGPPGSRRGKCLGPDTTKGRRSPCDCGGCKGRRG